MTTGGVKTAPFARRVDGGGLEGGGWSNGLAVK